MSNDIISSRVQTRADKTVVQPKDVAPKSNSKKLEQTKSKEDILDFTSIPRTLPKGVQPAPSKDDDDDLMWL